MSNQVNISYEPGDNEFNVQDPNEIFLGVMEILEYMKTPEIVKMCIDYKKEDEPESKKEKENKYREKIAIKFPVFSEKYFATFDKVVSGEDVTPLLYMLKLMSMVKKGNITPEDAESKIGHYLGKRYNLPMD